VRGKLMTRGQAKRADYILYYKPNFPLALIEAKDNFHSIGDGMQQALDYGHSLKPSPASSMAAQRIAALFGDIRWLCMTDHDSRVSLVLFWTQTTWPLAARIACATRLIAGTMSRAIGISPCAPGATK
jgi:type I site-specific restriction endonuclease